MHHDEELAELAVDLVAASSHFARAAFQASRFTLSYVSLRVLATLDREPGLRVGELAIREGITQPSMSQAVKLLVDGDLVTRTPSAEDARASELTVTQAGREVLSNYREISAHEVVPTFASLPPSDIAALQRAAELLPELTQALRRQR